MSTRDLAKILLIACPIILAVTIIIIVLFVPINGTMICTDEFVIGDLKQSIKYTVEYQKGKVKNIHFLQITTSDNDDAIIEYQKQILELEKENDLKNDSISFDGSKLKYEKNIEYNKQSQNTTSLKMGKVSVNQLKRIYTQNGAICNLK